MTIEAELSDGTVLEFPDGTAPDVIQRAVKQRIAAAKTVSAQPQEVPKSPADEMSALERGLVGAGGAFRQAYLGARSMFPGGELTPDEQEELNWWKKEKGKLGTAGTVGEIGAETSLFLVPGTAAAKVGGKVLPMLPKALQTLTGVGANVASDAALSAAFATEDRAKAAKEGAIGSLIGQGVVRGAGKLLGGPINPSEQAKTLMREGVQPTIGQGIDRGSFIGGRIAKAEEALQSSPVLGEIITSARQRPQGELVQKAFDRAVAPGGVTQTVSREGVDELGKQFKKAYAPLDMMVFKPDQKFEQEILSAALNPNYRASRETVDGILEFVDNNFFKKFQQGPNQIGAFIPGDAYKSFDSEISRRIRDLAGMQGTEALAERRILTAIEDSLTQYRNRQIPPALAQQLEDTDKAYAAYKRIARASKYSDSGEVTPSQLTRAVKAMSKGDDYGRGTAFMQDLTDPAAILKSRTPNSGTADRLAEFGLISSAIKSPVKTALGAGAAMTFGGPLYSRTAQRALLGGYKYQDALQEALRRRASLGGATGAAMMND